MTLHTAIDVNATFNTIGDIKPVYIRIEDQEHQLKVHKIDKILSHKIEQYAGTQSIIFKCLISDEEQIKEINIRYYFNSHKWLLINF